MQRLASPNASLSTSKGLRGRHAEPGRVCWRAHDRSIACSLRCPLKAICDPPFCWHRQPECVQPVPVRSVEGSIIAVCSENCLHADMRNGVHHALLWPFTNVPDLWCVHVIRGCPFNSGLPLALLLPRHCMACSSLLEHLPDLYFVLASNVSHGTWLYCSAVKCAAHLLSRRGRPPILLVKPHRALHALLPLPSATCGSRQTTLIPLGSQSLPAYFGRGCKCCRLEDGWAGLCWALGEGLQTACRCGQLITAPAVVCSNPCTGLLGVLCQAVVVP